jgi:predicted transcriptional regulator
VNAATQITATAEETSAGIVMTTPLTHSPFVFSIRPQHVAKILAGTKTFEYRTRRPSLSVGDSFLIYESRGRGGVVAKVEVTEIVDGCPCSVWGATQHDGGVTADEFFAYFDKRSQAVAIGVKVVETYSTPVPLPAHMHAPQAWAKWKGEWVTPAQ